MVIDPIYEVEIGVVQGTGEVRVLWRVKLWAAGFAAQHKDK
jgi:hypothetical protein